MDQFQLLHAYMTLFVCREATVLAQSQSKDCGHVSKHKDWIHFQIRPTSFYSHRELVSSIGGHATKKESKPVPTILTILNILFLEDTLSITLYSKTGCHNKCNCGRRNPLR